MTFRSPLQLLLPLLVFIAACGADDATGSATSQAAGGSGSVSAAGSTASGGKSSPGSAGASSIVAQGGSAGSASGSAGSSAAGTFSPPTTWNSAKSGVLSDTRLQGEYAAWKSAHAEACSNGSWVVVKDGAVVSEGIGYGMLLAAAMADQPLFDGLFKYYQEHLDKNGLMNWSTQKCEAPGNDNTNAATDADLDVAMALVQAAARWPSAGYLPKAQSLASKVLLFETDMCSGRRVLLPGDSWGGCNGATDKRINPSYFAPAYYKVFAHYFPEQAATWTALGDGSYQLYAIYQARMNNLVPDWSNPDGSDNGSQYWYDACRTPWRVAVDYAWSGDTRAKTFIQNVSIWVDAHGGLPQAAQQQNSAFLGAFALASAYEQGRFDTSVSSWLAANVDDAPYYQATLRVLYLLVAAGKFSSTL